MPELTTRDTKLIQYLNEAYGKEKELETALEAHIAMTTRAPYKKRLRDHLTETKRHAREVERRIKQLGGSPSTLATIATKAMATAKGPLHALRGTSEEEKLLKNAKTEYWNEAEEIATYTAIETLAETVGDRETAQLARAIRREEERMQSFLARQIPTLTKAVARAEIPASERNGGRKRSRSSSRRRSTSRSQSSNGSRTSSGSRSKSRSASSSRSTRSKSRSGSSSSRARSKSRARSTGGRS